MPSHGSIEGSGAGWFFPDPFEDFAFGNTAGVAFIGGPQHCQLRLMYCLLSRSGSVARHGLTSLAFS